MNYYCIIRTGSSCSVIMATAVNLCGALLFTLFIFSGVKGIVIVQQAEAEHGLFPIASLNTAANATTTGTLSETIANMTGNGIESVKSGFSSVISNISNIFNRTQGVENVILGATCTIDSNCSAVGNATCDKGVCNCRQNFTIANNTPDRCLSVITLGNPCEEDEQCSKGTIGSICSGHRCVCSELYTEEEGHCVSKKMESPAGELPCQVYKQCIATFGEMSSCINNICVCHQNYHFNNGKCQPDLRLGDSCSFNYDCIVSKYTEEPELRECLNNTCTCKPGSPALLDDKCSKGYRYQLQASLAWLLCIFFLPYVIYI